MKIRYFILLLSAIFFSACWHRQHTENKVIAKVQPVVKPRVQQTQPAVNDSLYVKNDSIYILSKGKLTRIPKVFDISNRISCNCIFETDGRTIRKSNILRLKNCIYFTGWDTTTGGLGTGHYSIYTFDTVTHNSDETNGDGKFLIDRQRNKMFDIGMGLGLYENAVIAIAGIHSIQDGKFTYIRNIYQKDISLNKGPGDEDDNLVLKFYSHSLGNNARYGLVLPKDWWKESD